MTLTLMASKAPHSYIRDTDNYLQSVDLLTS